MCDFDIHYTPAHVYKFAPFRRTTRMTDAQTLADSADEDSKALDLSQYDELRSYLRDCYHVQWGTNEKLVQDISSMCKELCWCSHDLIMAQDNAKHAMQQLRILTESYACRIKYLKLAVEQRTKMMSQHTCFESEVPLDVYDESAGLEPRQSPEALHVVGDEVELLAGI